MMDEDKPPELACIVRVRAEFLRAMFQLPEGAYIDSVYSPGEEPGVLMLRVRGMGYPVVEGTPLRKMGFIFRKTYTDCGDGYRLKVEWLRDDA